MAEAVWSELLAVGLLGTERRALGALEADGPLGALLSGAAGQPDAGPEQRWLAAVGAVGVYRRAGRRPIRLPAPEAAPAPDDTAPVCSPAASGHLALLLTGHHAEILPEWLALASAAGRRAPPERLPALLDVGRARSDLRPAIAAVLGRRGQWLAAQNPAWDYAVLALSGGEDAAELRQAWETAGRAERLALLGRLRAHRPQEAVRLLSATWAQEQAGDRADFVSALAESLGPDDEAFLEAALDDRAKGVRQAAAGLLASLPNSLLAQRMAARLQPLVTVERGWFKARRLALELPEACDAAMQRDGVTPRPRGARGEKAWWLLQMVAAAPLRFWTETLEAAPAECVRLAAPLEWRGLLLEGWTEAAGRQARAEPAAADWAEALLAAWLAEPEPSASLEPLLRALPRPRREAVILRCLAQDQALGEGRPALRLLTGIWDQWGPALSQAALAALVAHIAASRALNPGPVLGLLGQAAFCVDPAAALDFGPRLQQASIAQPYWPAAVERFIAITRFRHAMHQELMP